MADEVEIQRLVEEIPEEDRPVQTYIGLVDRYEFTQEQNGLIGGLAGAMNAVGTIQAFFGVLQIIGGFVAVVAMTGSWLAGLSSIVSGLVLGVTGVWVRQASNSLDVVVHSRGSDIHNLMEALENMAKAYRLQRAWYIAGILVAVVALGYGVYQFATASGGASPVAGAVAPRPR